MYNNVVGLHLGRVGLLDEGPFGQRAPFGGLANVDFTVFAEAAGRVGRFEGEIYDFVPISMLG